MPAKNVDGLPRTSVEQHSFSSRHWWLLVATFFIAYAVAVAIAIYSHRNQEASQRLATRLLAQGYAQRIQERLQTALVSTYVLASHVKQSSGRVGNFDHIAAELIALFPGVSALQLAPGGVIRQIYPLEGNEAAIGHDLLVDPKRNREAVAAVAQRQLTLAGPFNLIQGGMGAVGRLPIFLEKERHESHFWGFATALIRLPNLLDTAGLGDLGKAGYRYELWRLHPDTEQRQVFARNGEQPPASPVEYVMTVYSGQWILSLAPVDGWVTATDYVEIFGYSLVAALVVTLGQFVGLRMLLHEPY